MIRLGSDEKDSDFSSHYPEEFPAAGILISRHTIQQRRNQLQLSSGRVKPLPHSVIGPTVVSQPWDTLLWAESDLPKVQPYNLWGYIWNSSERWCPKPISVRWWYKRWLPQIFGF